MKILDSNINQTDIVDSKPPLPTTIINQDNSYSILNQKRREYSGKQQKNTPKSPHDISMSPNTTNELISPHQQQQSQVNVPLQIQNNTSTPDPQQQQKKAFFTKTETPVHTYNNKYGNNDTNDPKKFIFTKFNFSVLQEPNNSNNDSLNQTDTSDTNEFAKDYRKYQFINHRNTTQQKSPVNTNIVQIQQLPIQQNVSAFRPYSANVPSQAQTQQIQTNNMIPTNNFNGTTSNGNTNGVVYQQAYHSPKINSKFIPPRVLSADYINPQFKFKKYINR